MACKNLQILDVETSIDKAKQTQSGAPVPEPADIDCFWRPEYAIDPQYRATMDKWAWQYDRSQPESIQIKLSDGQSTSWSDYGHSEAQGDAGVSFLGLFRVGAGHGESTNWQKVQVDWSNSSVEFELTFKNIDLFDAHAGSW